MVMTVIRPGSLGCLDTCTKSTTTASLPTFTEIMILIRSSDKDSTSTRDAGSDISATCRSQNRGKLRATIDSDHEEIGEIKLQSMEMRLLIIRRVTTLTIVVLALLAG